MPMCYACDHQVRVWIDGLIHHYRINGEDQTWPYRLVECEECSLGFIDPMPDMNMLQTFYSSDYACYAHDPVYDPSREFKKYQLARMRFADFETGSLTPLSMLRRLIAITSEWVSGKTITYSLGIPLRLPQDAMILEIGYGMGHWLFNMASWGYKNLYGYDIDANPTSTAKLQSAGVTLSTDILTDNEEFVSKFDCIRLEHVFEHLLDPVEVLKTCRKLLKPDGLLVMTYPCKASLSRLISSRHWGPLDPPVHLYHHTPKSTRLMLQKAGFIALGVKPFSVTDQLIGTISNYLKAREVQDKRIIGQTLRVFSPVYRLVGILTRMGDFMTVLAKPQVFRPD